MSQQYQKQKKKWFNQGKLQAQKEELEFLQGYKLEMERNDCFVSGVFLSSFNINARIKQLQDKFKEEKNE